MLLTPELISSPFTDARDVRFWPSWNVIPVFVTSIYKEATEGLLSAIDWLAAWLHHPSAIYNADRTPTAFLAPRLQGAFPVRRLIHDSSNAFLAPRREPNHPARHRDLRDQPHLTSARASSRTELGRSAWIGKNATVVPAALTNAFMSAVGILVPSPGQTPPLATADDLFTLYANDALVGSAGNTTDLWKFAHIFHSIDLSAASTLAPRTGSTRGRDGSGVYKQERGRSASAACCACG
ncbi:hypothetical protein B0H13DRAFT_2318943 [Mycena leptocephala]|nr:hypothetical protein B0H13DRAFT_2318943 [Mycena leptocephala]